MLDAFSRLSGGVRAGLILTSKLGQAHRPRATLGFKCR